MERQSQGAYGSLGGKADTANPTVTWAERKAAVLANRPTPPAPPRQEVQEVQQVGGPVLLRNAEGREGALSTWTKLD